MYSWKDRLIDWVNQRGAWTHILVAVGIALLITAIILGAAMPSKGVVNANAGRISEVQNTIGTITDGLATKASQADLDNLSQSLTDTIDGQDRDIGGLRTRMSAAENGISEARTDITTIQSDMAGLSNSPPEAYLTGTFSNYTLHAKSNEAGNFTTNVHLVYSAPIYVGNATTHDGTLSAFYDDVIWMETTPAYAAVATFNGTAWGISEVWWNVGIFELEANTEEEIEVSCAWLNNIGESSFAYVGVWSVLR